jgi:hypothetical protein
VGTPALLDTPPPAEGAGDVQTIVRPGSGDAEACATTITRTTTPAAAATATNRGDIAGDLRCGT